MIAIVKGSASEEQLGHFVKWIENRGLKTDVSRGEDETIVGLVGDTTQVDPFLHRGHGHHRARPARDRALQAAPTASSTQRDTVVDCGPRREGGRRQRSRSWPAPARWRARTSSRIARAVKAAGATMLRGGAYKPRTSPYAYQGMGEKGLDLLMRGPRRARHARR